ncbi:HK97 family phage prohead protease [Aeromonas veronii]
MQINNLHCNTLLKAIGDGDDSQHYYFEGYANLFNVVDLYNHRTDKGAFAKSIERHKQSSAPLPILWNHDMTNPIGSWVEMVEDDTGLYVKGRLTKGVPQAEAAYLLLKGGDVTGLSIGCVNRDSERLGEVLILKELDLFEISIATVPINYNSRVQVVKSMLDRDEMPSISDVERALREIGFSRSQAKTLMSYGYKGLAHVAAIAADKTDEMSVNQDEVVVSETLNTTADELNTTQPDQTTSNVSDDDKLSEQDALAIQELKSLLQGLSKH